MGKLSLKNLGTGYVLFCVLFLCNFIISLAVIGLYATDVQRGNEERTGVNSKWVSVLRATGASYSSASSPCR